MSKNVIIVGGGLAGLSAAVFLARAGRTVTIFERRRYLGGRAVTHLRHGYRFNLGPHAFYRNGHGWNVLRELGIPVRGGIPKPRGIAMLGNERYKLPTNPWSLLTTSLLGVGAKAKLAMLMLRIWRIDPKPFASMTVREWIDFPGMNYVEHDGEAEILPGVRIVPAPGETRGHQIVVVDTEEGTVVIGGDVGHSFKEIGEADTPGKRLVIELGAPVYLAHDWKARVPRRTTG